MSFQPLDLAKNKAHKSKIEAVKEKVQLLNQTITNFNRKEEIQYSNYNSNDWTKTYKFWDSWEDVEEIKEELNHEENRLNDLKNECMGQINNNERPSFLNHRHEHSEERRIFEMTDKEKIKICKNKHLIGNYLFRQGLYSKAAEQYQLAVSLYEYCFPHNDSEQQILDELKQICLCNMSLCYIKMGSGYYRQAIDYALRVLSDRPSLKLKNKANFRLAQAYRLLDEYDEAIKYLNECENENKNNFEFHTSSLISSLSSSSSSSSSRLLHEEKLLLKKQKISSLIQEQRVSQMMININNNFSNNNIDKKTKKKNKKKNDFNISNIFIPLEIKI